MDRKGTPTFVRLPDADAGAAVTSTVASIPGDASAPSVLCALAVAPTGALADEA